MLFGCFWTIALFFKFKINHNGFVQGYLVLAELKIMQEVITLSVFVLFSMLYMKQQLHWNYLFAGICLVGAVFFK